MAWESALDRLVLRQIHLAEEGRVKDREVRAVIEDVLRLGGARPQSWFHSGYARTLLGLELPEPETKTGAAHRRWFAFGRLKGHVRRADSGWIADLAGDQELLLDLLVEPGIASQVLPTLMRTYFQDGDFEKAVCALEMMEARVGAAGDDGDEQAPGAELTLLVDAALIDLLARIERGTIAAEEEGSLRRALHRAMRIDRFEQLGPADRARFHRALGESHLSTGEWDEARECLERARALTSDGSRADRSVHLLLALTQLRMLDLGQLRPEAERPDRDLALELIGGAAAAPNPLPEALYARGILRYECGDYGRAAEDLDEAVRSLRQEPARNDALFARMRFFLGSSLLAGGVREEFRRAARLVEETVDRVVPDLQSFYGVYDALKTADPKVALRFLDHVDIGRGASAENLLLVALECQSLGEPARALRAAERVLELATDLDQRLDALKVRLCAHNMQGMREAARDDYFEIRELLTRRGAFDELERTLQDEALVGQALDHIEIKCELTDLYEEMEGKDWDRANLKLSLARAFKARKDVEDLRHALGLLEEVGIQYPDLASEDLQNLRKLLELRDGGDDRAASSPMQVLAQQLGHAPRVLVAGGNERQRKHRPRLEALATEWGFESEWLMANYSSPHKLVAQITERLGRIDLLVLLHWNRHETTEPALEKARQAGVPARTVFYAGFTSLQVCLEETARRLAGVGCG